MFNLLKLENMKRSTIFLILISIVITVLNFWPPKMAKAENNQRDWKFYECGWAGGVRMYKAKCEGDPVPKCEPVPCSVWLPPVIIVASD